MEDGQCTARNADGHRCGLEAGHRTPHAVTLDWPNGRACSAVLAIGRSTSREYPCDLERGHNGPHESSDGDHWEVRGVETDRSRYDSSRECRTLFRHPGTGELQRCNIVAGHIGGHQKIPLGHDAADPIPFDQFEEPETRRARWEAAAHAAGREVDRNALAAYMAVADAELLALANDWARSVASTDRGSGQRRVRGRAPRDRQIPSGHDAADHECGPAC